MGRRSLQPGRNCSPLIRSASLQAMELGAGKGKQPALQPVFALGQGRLTSSVKQMSGGD